MNILNFVVGMFVLLGVIYVIVFFLTRRTQRIFEKMMRERSICPECHSQNFTCGGWNPLMQKGFHYRCYDCYRYFDHSGKRIDHPSEVF